MGCLDARNALVTGGARGIGAAIVRRLAGEGAHVVFAYQGADAAAQARIARVMRQFSGPLWYSTVAVTKEWRRDESP